MNQNPYEYSLYQLQYQLQCYHIQCNDLKIQNDILVQRNMQLQYQCEMYKRELENSKHQTSNQSYTEINYEPDIDEVEYSDDDSNCSSKCLMNSNHKRLRSTETEDDCRRTSSGYVEAVDSKSDINPTINQSSKQRMKYYEWSQHYAALQEYYKVHGTCNVPSRDTFECDLPGLGKDGCTLHYKGSLGNWLRDNRQVKRGRGRKSRLLTVAPDQMSKLQILVDEGKLLWDVPTVSETSRKQAAIDWPRHYAALLEYGKEHGTCNIPHLRRYECDLPGLGENGSVFHYEGKLGSWLDRQRQSKKGFGKFNISEDQVAQLQTLVDQGKLRW